MNCSHCCVSVCNHHSWLCICIVIIIVWIEFFFHHERRKITPNHNQIVFYWFRILWMLVVFKSHRQDLFSTQILLSQAKKRRNKQQRLTYFNCTDIYIRHSRTESLQNLLNCNFTMTLNKSMNFYTKHKIVKAR